MNVSRTAPLRVFLAGICIDSAVQSTLGVSHMIHVHMGLQDRLAQPCTLNTVCSFIMIYTKISLFTFYTFNCISALLNLNPSFNCHMSYLALIFCSFH